MLILLDQKKKVATFRHAKKEKRKKRDNTTGIFSDEYFSDSGASGESRVVYLLTMEGPLIQMQYQTSPKQAHPSDIVR